MVRITRSTCAGRVWIPDSCSCSNRAVTRIYALAVGVLLACRPSCRSVSRTSRRPPPSTRARPAHPAARSAHVGGAAQRAGATSSPHSGRATRSRTRRRPRAASAPRGSGSSTSSARQPRLQVCFDTYKLAREAGSHATSSCGTSWPCCPEESAPNLSDRALRHGEHRRSGSDQRQYASASDTQPPDPQLRANQNYDVDAPGANDNGSGTALTMELARVFARERPGIRRDAGVRALGWRRAGPHRIARARSAIAARQGRRRRQLQQRHRRQLARRRRYGTAESVRVYSEGPEDSRSRSLARYIARVAALYVPSHQVRLMARPDRFSRGSDHTSFSDRGYAAVAFREANENFAEAAFGARHGRRRRFRLPRAERARECGQHRRAGAGASGAGRDEPARSGCDRHGSPRATTRTCGGIRRRARRRIESTGARPGRTTGASHVCWRRHGVHAAGSRSTTTSSASPPSAPDGHESLVSAYVERRQKRGPVKLVP